MHSMVWHMYVHGIELVCSDDSWHKDTHTYTTILPLQSPHVLSFKIRNRHILKERQGTEEQDSKVQRDCHTNWQVRQKQAGKNITSLSGKCRSNEMDKQAEGSTTNWTAGKSKWQVVWDQQVRRQMSTKATTKNTGGISQADTVKLTGVDVGNKAGCPVHPGRYAIPLLLWHWGDVSRSRVLLIHCWGGVLTLTSVLTKPLQPALGSQLQLYQETSRADLATRFQWCVCPIAWYSNISLILL